MKKIIALTLMAAMAVMTIGPGLVVATSGTGTNEVTTTLIQNSGTGCGEVPIIKAKWEMREYRAGDPTYKRVGYWTDGAYANWWYEDDHSVDGAQLLPSGDENVNTPIQICAVVAHSDLIGNLSAFSVSADVYYPELKTPKKPTEFCGNMISEIDLLPLSRTDGMRLVCGDATFDGIKQNDPGLPTFSDTCYNDFVDICTELDQEEAKVFCGPIVLSYEDIAGDYLVKVHVISPDNKLAGLNNTFDYLELNAFKIDFSTIDYGTVNLNDFAYKSGDRVMGTGNAPTIQGTGNTVLSINVNQDDMGFGQRLVNSVPTWNVKYKARLDSTPVWSSLSYYYPDLNYSAGVGYDLINLLDLSEIQKLDFGVYVEKFLSDQIHPGSTYSGNMTLTATDVDLESCIVPGWPVHP